MMDGPWNQADEMIDAPYGEGDVEYRPLYACRSVTNAAAIIAWAAEQGFKTTLPAEAMHVTVAYSSAPMDGGSLPETIPAMRVLGGIRTVEPLGDQGAVVLKFASPKLKDRWSAYCKAGASWDYDSYTPHITLTYDGADMDLGTVKPYAGPIELGAETQEDLNEEQAEEYDEVPTVHKPDSSPIDDLRIEFSAATRELDTKIRDISNDRPQIFTRSEVERMLAEQEGRFTRQMALIVAMVKDQQQEPTEEADDVVATGFTPKYDDNGLITHVDVQYQRIQ